MNELIQDTNASEKEYKRSVRNLLIHRPMQREFTLVITALLMISMFAIGFIIHDTIRDAAFGGGFHFGKINPYEVLSEVRYQLLLKISSVFFATLIIITFFGVFFLHRIAGPVHRFRGILLKINRGHLPSHFQIREGDFFMETANEINQLLRDLQEDANKKKLIKEKISQLITSNPASPLIKDLQELQRILDVKTSQSLPSLTKK